MSLKVRLFIGTALTVAVTTSLPWVVPTPVGIGLRVLFGLVILSLLDDGRLDRQEIAGSAITALVWVLLVTLVINNQEFIFPWPVCPVGGWRTGLEKGVRIYVDLSYGPFRVNRHFAVLIGILGGNSLNRSLLAQLEPEEE